MLAVCLHLSTILRYQDMTCIACVQHLSVGLLQTNIFYVKSKYSHEAGIQSQGLLFMKKWEQLIEFSLTNYFFFSDWTWKTPKCLCEFREVHECFVRIVSKGFPFLTKRLMVLEELTTFPCIIHIKKIIDDKIT